MENKQEFLEVLGEYFGGKDSRFFDATRIPRICEDIKWLKIALFGLYGLVGTGVVAILVVVVQSAHK